MHLIIFVSLIIFSIVEIIFANDVTPSTSQEAEFRNNWWILVIGIVLMVIVGIGLLALGYKCSGEARTRKSERESRRAATLE